MAAIRVVRAFIPSMMERRSGRIVLPGSEDAEQPYPDELPSCAAKAAILNLSKGLSKTYAKHGIPVNAVSPALVATPMTDAMMEKRSKERGESFDEAVQSFLKQERPTLEFRRRGKVEDVAAAIFFLCSKQASFITGTYLRIDGGSVATVWTPQQPDMTSRPLAARQSNADSRTPRRAVARVAPLDTPAPQGHDPCRNRRLHGGSAA